MSGSLPWRMIAQSGWTARELAHEGANPPELSWIDDQMIQVRIVAEEIRARRSATAVILAAGRAFRSARIAGVFMSVSPIAVVEKTRTRLTRETSAAGKARRSSRRTIRKTTARRSVTISLNRFGDPCRLKNALERGKNIRGGKLHETSAHLGPVAPVPSARPAVERQGRDPVFHPPRPPVVLARRTEEGDDRRTDGGGDVHRRGIHAEEDLRPS